jgi:hypothetical protein
MRSPVILFFTKLRAEQFLTLDKPLGTDAVNYFQGPEDRRRSSGIQGGDINPPMWLDPVSRSVCCLIVRYLLA